MDFRHDELVVGEDAASDRLGQVQAVDDGAVDGGVVHRGESFDPGARLRVGCGAPVAGRGGHVEAVRGRDGAVVVDERPALVPVAAGAVGFVGQGEGPGQQPFAAVGLGDGGQGGVGGEDGDASSLGDAAGQDPGVCGEQQTAAQAAVVNAGQ
ncbi:hypothetical protein [Streptomyces sp. BBFR109]|uniref:hypothetical protein n=1 Tax=Streptomyces sp. BBFR109 TaxID=3448172 RepID=UPI003F75AC19